MLRSLASPQPQATVCLFFEFKLPERLWLLLRDGHCWVLEMEGTRDVGELTVHCLDI